MRENLEALAPVAANVINCSDTNDANHWIGELLEEYEPELRAFLFRYLRCEADISDTIQDVAVRIIRLEDRSPLQDNPRSYLFCVAMNLVRDRARRESARRYQFHQALDEFQVECPSFSPECRAVSKDILAHINNILENAGARVREVVLLTCIYQFTHAEIAAHLGVTVRTVERSMARARELCRPIMVEYYGDSLM